MAEATFAKQYLAALESRPIKLSSDHVADARTLPAQSTYTLPRISQLPKRRKLDTASSTDPASSTSGPTITAIIKPLRGSPLKLPSQSINTTSVYNLKSAYASHASVDVGRIRLLYERRAQTDSRTLAEVFEASAASGAKVPQDGEEATFSVVVSAAPAGGPERVASPPVEAPSIQSPPVAPDVTSGLDVLTTDAFWNDLKGFLEQRVRDEAVAGRLVQTFKTAWQSGK